jgi:hypothetical protein
VPRPFSILTDVVRLLPNSLYAVTVEDTVPADDGNAEIKGLCDEKAVEGIAVVQR